MIELIHRYRKTFGGFLILFLLTISFSGFGLQASRILHEESIGAVSVNDKKYSFEDIAQQKRETQLSGQPLVDRLIASALIEQEAAKLNLHAGEGSVRDILMTDLFRGNFDPAGYAAFLRQVGMSAGQFEKQLRGDAVKRQLIQLLNDSSSASILEARSLLEREETLFSATYLEFDPVSFLSKAEKPTDEVIQSYYADHSSEFEVPSGVQYDYVLFSPEKYEASVEVTDEDLESYYSDHENEYAIPETLRARKILIVLPSEASETQRKEAEEKANQALSRAKAGESFEALVAEFSDDVATKSAGGDLGWVRHGKIGGAADTAAFELKGPGITEVIKDESGYQIIKVEEFQAASSKPLSAVKDEITKIIQKRESSAHAATRAMELFEDFQKSGKPLAAFAAEHGLTAVSTKGVLVDGKDPEKDTKGLTNAVINNPDPRQVAEYGSRVAIVEVMQRRETDTAPLAEVKGKIEEKLKAQSAHNLAKEAAQATLAKLQGNTYGSISDAAQKEKLTLRESKDLKRTGTLNGIFADKNVASAVFSTGSVSQKPTTTFTVQGKYYIVAVSEMKKPDMSKLAEKVELFDQMQSARNSETLAQSLINQLKAKSEIQVSPSVLAEG